MIRWYRSLTAKIVGIGLIFLVLMGLSLRWHYEKVRTQLIEASKKDAAHLAENIMISIETFVLEVPQGGAMIKYFVQEINSRITDAQIFIVRSDAVNEEYGANPDQMAKHEFEKLSLQDGKERAYEDENNFINITPIKSARGCGVCHILPDGSGRHVPDGYVLGLAVVHVPNGTMKDRLSYLWNESIKNLFIISSLLAFLGLFTTRFIVMPLRRMLRIMRNFSHGDISERVKVAQNDEIGMLGESFNLMADQLDTSFKKLSTFNDELKAEVEEQTTKLREIRDHFEAIIDSSQRVIYTTGKNLIIESVNAEWDVMAHKHGVNIKRDELIGKNLLKFFAGEERKRYYTVCRTILQAGRSAVGKTYRSEFDAMIKGEKRFFSVTISPFVSQEGEVSGLVFVSADVSKSKRAEEMLRVERNKLDAIMNGMGAAVCIVDMDRKIAFMNQVMEMTFGENALGKVCWEVITGNPNLCDGCRIEDLEGTCNLELKAQNGRTYLVTHSPIIDVDGKRALVEVFEDISHLKEMEDQLRQLTITDNLTGLFNKRHFVDKLTTEIIRAKRQNAPLSLLFADIDKFKSYNDTYGHVEGDGCLATVGRIIRDSIRAHVDGGFRYGGEEFTVILPGTNAEQAMVVAERVRETFRDTRFTPMLNGERVDVYKTISLGLATFKEDNTMDEFIDRADVAMYRAKRDGGDRVYLAE